MPIRSKYLRGDDLSFFLTPEEHEEEMHGLPFDDSMYGHASRRNRKIRLGRIGTLLVRVPTLIVETGEPKKKGPPL